ncbi:MAG: dihydrolipoamide acetyltransferase family protein [Caldilineaceae bacterium]
MPTPVIMPKFEMAQETGTVLQWLKQEGDVVQKGDAILEVETDKITMEVESPASGVLAGIRAAAADVIPIGQTIAFILAASETLPLLESAPVRANGAGESAKPVVTPVAARLAESHGVDVAALAQGDGKRITRAHVESYLQSQQPVTSTAAPIDKIRAVPAARRLARELGVDLAQVAGSGPHGRIQSVDVQVAAAAFAPPLAAPEPVAAPTPTDRPPATGQLAIRRVVPLSTMRRTIAQRLTASVQDAPQFVVGMEMLMGRAQEVVADLRSVGNDAGVKVTLTAFLVRACAWSLQRHPAINASFAGTQITEWADVNIGVATAVEEGLLVPVIHHADRLSLIEIAAQLDDLSTRARAGQLQPADLSGGTFTISNLGMFGVDHFTAILNPPQAAILAVGRVAQRPHVLEDGRIEARSLATFNLTADHRAVDGALAGRFLADLRRAIEHPGLLL